MTVYRLLPDKKAKIIFVYVDEEVRRLYVVCMATSYGNVSGIHAF